MSQKKSKTPKKKPEPFWKKFPKREERSETTFEVQWWPPKSFKGGPRAGNVGMGTYRDMGEVEAAVKRADTWRKATRRPKGELRVYMIYTTRERIH